MTQWVMRAVLVMVGAWVAVVMPSDAAAMSTLAIMALSTGIDNTQEIQKIIFNEPLIVNVVTDSELMGHFQTDTNVQVEATTGGRYIESAHYFAYSGGAGAVVERGAFPRPRPPKFANSRVYLKKLGGSVELTGDNMRRVTGDVGAYINYMERALPDLVQRLVDSIDRQYLGYGFGVKGRIASISAYNTPAAGQFQVTVDRSFGVTGWTQPWTNFLEEEFNVFTASVAGPSITLKNAGPNQAAAVVNINPNTNVITYEGPSALHGALAVNDFIAEGDAGRSSFPNGNPMVTVEITGLLAAVDDGTLVATYMNIPRANNRLWQGQVVNGAVAPFSGVLSSKLLNFADRQSRMRGKGAADLIVVSNAGYDTYWNSLTGQQMFVDPRGQYIDGRNNGLQVVLGDRVVTLKVARKMPPEVAYGLQTNAFVRFALNQWEWISQTGSIWRGVGDANGYYDIYVAFGVMYEELFCKMPAANWRLTGLTPAF